MTILFFKDSEISPNIGGIARINYTLSTSLKNNGYDILYLGIRKKTDVIEEQNQYWLPNAENVLDESNVAYFNSLLINKNVAVIINSFFDINAVKLITCAKEGVETKVITWFHNNVAEYSSLWGYRNERRFVRNNLIILYKLATNKIIVRMLSYIGRLKHRRTTREAYKTSDKIVVVSKGNIREFISILGKKDRRHKVISIDNFVPTISIISSEKKKTVVWCGAINFDLKKTHWMLDIWREVSRDNPDWTLYILGDSPLLNAMEDYARQLSVSNVYFEGRVNPSPYYSEASILCSTSITESFGLTIVEGMQYGAIPIAFASSPSIREIVEGNGVLIKPFDKGAFIQEMKLLMSDESRRSALADKCITSSTQYTSERIVPMWIKVFNELIDSI